MRRSGWGVLLSVCVLVGGGTDLANGQGAKHFGTSSTRGEYVVSAEVDALIGIRQVSTFEAVEQPMLDRTVELRRWIGLYDDPSFVRSLYEGPQSEGVYVSDKTLVGGLRFLASEAGAVLAISQLEVAASRIADIARSHLGDGVFSGAEVKRRVLTLYCKACTTSDLAEVISPFGEPFGDGNRFDVVDVQYSVAELTDLEAEVAKFLAHSGEVYGGSGVDFATNSVLVLGSKKLEAKTLEAFAGRPVRFEIEESMPVDEVTKWDPLGYGVVEGGQGIMRQDLPYQWAACTSGFAVNNSVYGPFMLTAGHCSSFGAGCTTGQTWIQGGATLGVMSACRFQGGLDAAMISTAGWRNNIGRIHDSDVDYFHAVTFGVTTQNLSGVTVCQHGVLSAVSAPACGTVLQLTFRPSGTGDDGLIWSADFVRANYVSTGGDSGSGITWSTIYGYGAAGIHKSSVPSGAYFTKFSRIASYWALTITPP